VTVCDGMGDRGIYMALKAYEPIVKAHPDEDLRFGIDHSQITTEGIIEEYARLHVTAGCELVFVKSDIEIAEDRVGKHRASLSYNWKRFFDNGCVVAAGSDSPVEDFSPLLGIEGAVNRRDWNDQPKEGWFPDQCLTVEQAVSAFTTGAAYANYEEDLKGTIEAGKFADLIVLSDDIFTIDKDKLADITVDKTIIGGKTVFSR
ncbi:MAG: amidohydrolase family protein, partial [Anaerovoracaceae bacterium]